MILLSFAITKRYSAPAKSAANVMTGTGVKILIINGRS